MSAVYKIVVADKQGLEELQIERGMHAFNKSHGFAPPVEQIVLAHDEQGQVIGGAYGELVWGWLYVDLVWVHPDQRGSGLGKKVMTSLEQAAIRQDIPHSFLATTSFQALPFYYAVGYQLFGVLENRPPGYNYYYLKKTLIPESTEGLLPVTDDYEPEDMHTLQRGLSAHNRTHGIAPDGKRLSVYVQDDQGQIKGGLIAATYWGWLDIQMLYLDESLRGQGYGKQLLATAEAQARERECKFAFADCADFQNLAFLESQGYETFTQLEDRPPGYNTHFMKKSL